MFAGLWSLRTGGNKIIQKNRVELISFFLFFSLVFKIILKTMNALFSLRKELEKESSAEGDRALRGQRSLAVELGVGVGDDTCLARAGPSFHP